MEISGYEVFLLGMLGGMAPEILRLFELRAHPDRFAWSWKYLLCTIPMFVTAGLFARLLLPHATPWAAVYVGLSTPTLISTAVRHGLKLPPHSKGLTLYEGGHTSLLTTFFHAL